MNAGMGLLVPYHGVRNKMETKLYNKKFNAVKGNELGQKNKGEVIFGRQVTSTVNH